MSDDEKKLLDRILDRTTRNPVTGCWECSYSARNVKGYRCLSVRDRTEYVHRAVYTLLCGDPGDLQVLHECDNPRCVHPAHLSLGTNDENQRQKKERGRANNRRWATHVREQVAAMLAAGVPKTAIARQLRVTREGVTRFARRRKLAAAAT
jgi:hypothetical protein